MTPADEATFCTLWQQGASYRELAAALGCPLGTVASRAAALVAQGKIQPRRRAKARPQDAWVSTDTPRVSPRVSPDTPPVQYLPVMTKCGHSSRTFCWSCAS